MKTFLIYGATGYTGKLIVETAIKRGLRPILAGRNPDKVRPLAEKWGLEWTAFSLEESDKLKAALLRGAFVLNCAGPFSKTWKFFRDACIETQRHYLDITGELAVFEGFAAADAEAKKAGIFFLPGMGFDVVPTDCLAKKLKENFPGAVSIRMALSFKGGGFSRGTLASVTDTLGETGKFRKGGKMVPLALGSLQRDFDFGKGPRRCVALPLADSFSAGISTQVPDVTLFMNLPPNLIRYMKWAGMAGFLLRTNFVRQLILKRIAKMPEGPSPEQREKGTSLIIGEAEDRAGNIFRMKLEGPSGYQLTALTSVAACEIILRQEIPPGFQTPSLAFGSDFAEKQGACGIQLLNAN